MTMDQKRLSFLHRELAFLLFQRDGVKKPHFLVNYTDWITFGLKKKIIVNNYPLTRHTDYITVDRYFNVTQEVGKTLELRKILVEAIQRSEEKWQKTF